MKTVEEILGRVLAINPKEITDDSGPATIESWDSFNGLMLVTELEKNFKVSFSLEEVVGVKTVKDIKRILRSHGISLPE